VLELRDAPRTQPRVTRGKLESLSPLAVGGTDMPPNLLLLTKLVAVCFLISGQWASLPKPFLPFVGVLGDLGSPAVFKAALSVVFLVAALMLLTNRSPRAASLALGLVLLVALLSSRTYVENNRFYACLLFLLAGLSDRRTGGRLIQLQIVVLYCGAALNKLLDVDWRSGQYFENLVSVSPLASTYSGFSGLLPSLVLSALLGWAVIVTEFALAGAFMARRFIPIAIWVGVAYHTSLVLITGRTFGMFWFAATASYLAFVAWPTRVHVECGWRGAAQARLRNVVQSVDVERTISWAPAHQSGLRVISGAITYRGVAAAVRLGLALPAALFAFYAFAALPMLNHRAVAALVLAVLTAFAISVVRAAVEAARVPASRVVAESPVQSA
jgi:hypothetical protein